MLKVCNFTTLKNFISVQNRGFLVSSKQYTLHFGKTKHQSLQYLVLCLYQPSNKIVSKVKIPTFLENVTFDIWPIYYVGLSQNIEKNRLKICQQTFGLFIVLDYQRIQIKIAWKFLNRHVAYLLYWNMTEQINIV